MRIQKSNKPVEASTEVTASNYDDAIKYIRAAIDILGKSGNKDAVTKDSIANLATVMFDIKASTAESVTKLKDIKNKDNLLIRIDTDSDGLETIYRMLDRYDRSWPNEPWEVTFNKIFDTKLDYHDKHHVITMPYSEFVEKCPYSEKTIMNYPVEVNGNTATLLWD